MRVISPCYGLRYMRVISPCYGLRYMRVISPCYRLQLLSGLCQTAGSELFKCQPAVESLLLGLARCVEHVHLFSLKLVIRNALRPLISACPPSFRAQLLPVMLELVLLPIAGRLEQRWSVIRDSRSQCL